MAVSLGLGERASLETLHDPDRGRLEPQLDQLLRYGAAHLVEEVLAGMAGQPEFDRSEWEFPDDWLKDDSVVATGDRQLHVVETPGHTRGHVVFHDAAGQLPLRRRPRAADDHPLDRFRALAVPKPPRRFPLSLARCASCATPACCPPMVPSHRARMLASTSSWSTTAGDSRRQRLRSRGGADTAFEVAGPHSRWTRRERRVDELDRFNQMLAVARRAPTSPSSSLSTGSPNPRRGRSSLFRRGRALSRPAWRAARD